MSQPHQTEPPQDNQPPDFTQLADTADPAVNRSRTGRSDAAAFDVSLQSVLDAVLDGQANPQQQAAIADALADDPSLIDDYIAQVRMHALLQWRYGQARPTELPLDPNQSTAAMPAAANGLTGNATDPLTRRTTDSPTIESTTSDRRDDSGFILKRSTAPRNWSLVIAASIALVAAATALFQNNRNSAIADAALGEVAASTAVEWANGQTPLLPGDSIRAGEFAIRAGTLRLQLTSDTLLTVTGPAKFELLTPMRMRAFDGRFTALVGSRGKGFTVESPSADVIDLGTEFGVQVDSAGLTDVVVFEGQVDLLRRDRKQPHDRQPEHPLTRMNKGEGLQVASDGELSRIVSIEGQPSDGDWDVKYSHSKPVDRSHRVISAVRDNLRDPANSKYYRIVHGGLQDDVAAYVDRSYQYNAVDSKGLPPELRGADLVMTFNSDKRTPDLQLTVTLSRPASLYVFMSNDATPPIWLTEGFELTNLQIGLDEGPPDMPKLNLKKGPGKSVDRVFKVWRRKVSDPGSIILGDNAPVKTMYGIAAVALP